ncbi:RHS repeat-associated core domain-containing protein [Pseudomonas sp. OA65]|uniref:RHS repeat-associated core domain-containing protein n=1 Tax=Pseudomonas sp. OA65 TaxID=2818431 RepID=UPI001FB05F1E|nr:RHS repeat-associated core domain-containing protein [Pseudomonas sp. OA65]
MPSLDKTLLCRYHYDPLDRLAACTPSTQARTQRFYQKERLTSEIQGSVQRSIFQQGDQLLAQQQRQDDAVETTLLATDQQRSALHALDVTQPHPLAYTPYGHRPAENGLLSLLGFNGERPDPVTGHYLLGNGYRAFNPVLMRFNSPDSLSPFGGGGLNAYAYCAGDPVNQQDPTGHFRLPGLMPVSIPNLTPKILNIGSFNSFLGTPHIIDKIIRELPGDSLVALSLTSKDMSRVVKSNILPLTVKAPAEELSPFEIYKLRSVALGESKRHLPAQVLEYENLKDIAKSVPSSDIPMEEMSRTMTFQARLKARLLPSKHASHLPSNTIRQQT